MIYTVTYFDIIPKHTTQKIVPVCQELSYTDDLLSPLEITIDISIDDFLFSTFVKRGFLKLD